MASATAVFYNGRFYTVDSEDSVAGALAVRNERILGVGRSPEEIRGLTDRDTEWIDLGGATVIPGIIDSHNHVPMAGLIMDGVMLFDAQSIEDLKEMVAQKADTLEPGKWILGGGWIENQFEEWRLPTREDLDQVAPDHPVLLRRLFGMCVVNSRALEAAGITASTPDPEGGRIDRHPDTGRPTGILRDRAQAMVDSAVSRGDMGEMTQRLETSISRAAQEYTRWGITSVVDPGVPPLAMRAYQNLYLRGDLPIRVNMMPAWHGLQAVADEEELTGRLDHLGVYTGFGDHHLSLGALKMAIDGGLGSKTSLMYQEYIDGTRSEVPLRLDADRLGEYVEMGHSRGWSIGIHTCGDKAQDMACRVLAQAIDRGGRERPHHHNIIHGYFPTEESLDIMARSGIAVSAQPGFIWVEGDLYLTVISPERAAQFKPLKTYIDRGILVACNSDMTSAHYNPFWGMHSALTRKTALGEILGADECLTREQTLRAFTLNGAILTGEERDKGSLEPGKLADMAVLDRDIMAVPDEQVREAACTMTVLGGRVIYQR